MGRPRDPAVAARNEEIYARWYGGESVQELAERYNRKPVVIGRIIAKRHPELKDDTNRSLMRGRLEWLLTEMRDVINNPGWKLTPQGKVALDDDDQPILDLATKIEAGKVYLATLDRAAKNDASDKAPKPPPMTYDMARQQMEESMVAIAAEKRRLEELARRGTVVPGEVVREIEPPQPS